MLHVEKTEECHTRSNNPTSPPVKRFDDFAFHVLPLFVNYASLLVALFHAQCMRHPRRVGKAREGTRAPAGRAVRRVEAVLGGGFAGTTFQLWSPASQSVLDV